MKGISLGRWAVAVLFGMLAALCFGVAIAVGLGFTGNATSSDLAESNRRTDCRSAYNADFTEVIRARDHAKIDLDILRYNADIATATGVPITDADVTAFVAKRDEVQVLNNQVDALPKLDDAVDHGYTLDGVHHPPCPG